MLTSTADSSVSHAAMSDSKHLPSDENRLRSYAQPSEFLAAWRWPTTLNRNEMSERDGVPHAFNASSMIVRLAFRCAGLTPTFKWELMSKSHRTSTWCVLSCRIPSSVMACTAPETKCWRRPSLQRCLLHKKASHIQSYLEYKKIKPPRQHSAGIRTCSSWVLLPNHWSMPKKKTITTSRIDSRMESPSYV